MNQRITDIADAERQIKDMALTDHNIGPEAYSRIIRPRLKDLIKIVFAPYPDTNTTTTISIEVDGDLLNRLIEEARPYDGRTINAVKDLIQNMIGGSALNTAGDARTRNLHEVLSRIDERFGR